MIRQVAASSSMTLGCLALLIAAPPSRRCFWRRTPDTRRARWATRGSCTSLPPRTAAASPPACRPWLLCTRLRSAACPHAAPAPALAALVIMPCQAHATGSGLAATPHGAARLPAPVASCARADMDPSVRSWQAYRDDLAWAAGWLYAATHEANFLRDAHAALAESRVQEPER